MKRINILSVFFIFFFFISIQAQNTNSCAHCNMIIKDSLHIASAKIDNKTIQFDAIECLVNYIKTRDEVTFSTLQVSDYNTGKLTDAKTATYLQSEAIPSPMGANLSAFKNEKEAIQLQKDKGGEIFSWEEIITKFKDSKFGAVNHSHHNHNRPDAHAPIGIMGDHLHEKGGLMVSLRYMHMTMDGNTSGTDAISDNAIYNSYMVAPQDMTMQMYMLGVMYAPSDNLAIMLMQNLVQKDMNLTARMLMDGMTMTQDFSTSTTGLGDLKVGAMYGLYTNHKTSLHINGNVNIPVGDIENKADTPMMDNAKLPYAMQLGSGTIDMTLGATLKGNFTNASWGTQILSTFRTGKNSQDYRFGNVYQLNIWGAYNLSKNFSVSGRVLGMLEGKLEGADPDLNAMMVPAADTSNYGSDKIKTFIGFNIAFPKDSSLKDLRFGIEAGAPVYENYNGIQMNEDLSINFGVKYNVL